MERHSHWIQLQVDQGVWRPLKSSRSGPKISHLVFAVDLLLFAEAAVDQIDCI